MMWDYRYVFSIKESSFPTVLGRHGLQHQRSKYRHREGHDCGSSFARYHLRRRGVENAGSRALRWPERNIMMMRMMMVVVRGGFVRGSHLHALQPCVTQKGGEVSLGRLAGAHSTTAAGYLSSSVPSAPVQQRGNHLCFNHPFNPQKSREILEERGDTSHSVLSRGASEI